MLSLRPGLITGSLTASFLPWALRSRPFSTVVLPEPRNLQQCMPSICMGHGSFDHRSSLSVGLKAAVIKAYMTHLFIYLLYTISIHIYYVYDCPYPVSSVTGTRLLRNTEHASASNLSATVGGVKDQGVIGVLPPSPAEAWRASDGLYSSPVSCARAFWQNLHMHLCQSGQPGAPSMILGCGIYRGCGDSVLCSRRVGRHSRRCLHLTWQSSSKHKIPEALGVIMVM